MGGYPITGTSFCLHVHKLRLISGDGIGGGGGGGGKLMAGGRELPRNDTNV